MFKIKVIFIIIIIKPSSANYIICCCWIGTSKGYTWVWDTPIKQDSGTFYGCFKIFQRAPPSLLEGSTPPPGSIYLQNVFFAEEKREHHIQSILVRKKKKFSY